MGKKGANIERIFVRPFKHTKSKHNNFCGYFVSKGHELNKIDGNNKCFPFKTINGNNKCMTF